MYGYIFMLATINTIRSDDFLFFCTNKPSAFYIIIIIKVMDNVREKHVDDVAVWPKKESLQ